MLPAYYIVTQKTENLFLIKKDHKNYEKRNNHILTKVIQVIQY